MRARCHHKKAGCHHKALHVLTGLGAWFPCKLETFGLLVPLKPTTRVWHSNHTSGVPGRNPKNGDISHLKNVVIWHLQISCWYGLTGFLRLLFSKSGSFGPLFGPMEPMEALSGLIRPNPMDPDCSHTNTKKPVYCALVVDFLNQTPCPSIHFTPYVVTTCR